MRSSSLNAVSGFRSRLYLLMRLASRIVLLIAILRYSRSVLSFISSSSAAKEASSSRPITKTRYSGICAPLSGTSNRKPERNLSVNREALTLIIFPFIISLTTVSPSLPASSLKYWCLSSASTSSLRKESPPLPLLAERMSDISCFRNE